jgi:hypothetical protein
MSSSQPQLHEEEKTMTVTDIDDSEALMLQGKTCSNEEQSLSDQTFNKKKDSSEETNQKRDKTHKKKNHLMSLKNERILKDIPQNDEKILRHLFKKFTNSWSLFQKHSKLQGKYSVQNLKTLKSKVEKVESLYSNH